MASLAALASFEKMTWQQIEEKRSCGDIELTDVDNKGSDARARLVDLKWTQYSTLCKLRIDKKGRVWGVRERHIFQILWWDPGHTVYPMDVTGNSN